MNMWRRGLIFVISSRMNRTRNCRSYRKSEICFLRRKEKLQKLQQDEEELQLEKRDKKRKIKGSSRLSFAEDLENASDEDDGENKSSGTMNLRCRKLGKDPSVEFSFTAKD